MSRTESIRAGENSVREAQGDKYRHTDSVDFGTLSRPMQLFLFSETEVPRLALESGGGGPISYNDV